MLLPFPHARSEASYALPVAQPDARLACHARMRSKVCFGKTEVHHHEVTEGPLHRYKAKARRIVKPKPYSDTEPAEMLARDAAKELAIAIGTRTVVLAAPAKRLGWISSQQWLMDTGSAVDLVSVRDIPKSWTKESMAVEPPLELSTANAIVRAHKTRAAPNWSLPR